MAEVPSIPVAELALDRTDSLAQNGPLRLLDRTMARAAVFALEHKLGPAHFVHVKCAGTSCVEERLFRLSKLADDVGKRNAAV